MTSDPVASAQILHEARVAGLAKAAPSLDDVAGRRLQLWGLTAFVFLAMAAAVALSIGRDLPGFIAIPPVVARVSAAVLAVAFCAYSVEKELHLRRLTALLVDERVRAVALQGEVERLLESDRMRSEFVASVGHDLRAPLTAILGAAELLRGPLPLRDREALLDSVDRQGRHLRSMIDELLAAAVLEREGPPLELTVLDLGAIARSAAADLEAAGRPVEVDAPAALVRASADGLRRVVNNLVTNAYDHGRPPVRMSVAVSGDEAVLTVSDAGPGVPEADRRRVFELFTRLDRDHSDPGIGLGLGIVAGLAGAWGDGPGSTRDRRAAPPSMWPCPGPEANRTR